MNWSEVEDMTNMRVQSSAFRNASQALHSSAPARSAAVRSVAGAGEASEVRGNKQIACWHARWASAAASNERSACSLRGL